MSEFQSYVPDQTSMKDFSIKAVVLGAIFGIIFIFVLLYLFLGLGNALLAGMGIPLSYLVAFILMYWTGNTINGSSVFAMIIVLGIIVDDTIHVSLRYRLERSRASSAQSAIAATFARVGEPVLTTTLCLALGFSVLMFSRWGGLVSFGLLASLGMILAIVADLLLLPAALVGRDTRRGA